MYSARAMLKATRFLIESATGARRISWPVEHACTRAVIRRGSIDDAAALLEAFLAAPAERGRLLDALMFVADERMARAVLKACCDGRGLREGMPAKVLHLAGYHGLVEAQPMLWGYASGDPDFEADNEWDANAAAVRGLLHLPCDGLKEEIADAIHECVGESLFPEFLPALAAKTGDAAMVDTLWEIGEGASTDCNGGVLLGFAMFGEKGRARLEQAMWSPHWEAFDTGTGSVGALFDAMCVLRMPLGDVYEQWKRRLEEGGDQTQGVFLLTNLLRTRLRHSHTGLRFAPHPVDDAVAVHERLFAWSTPHRDDSFGALVRQAFERVGHQWTEDFVRDIDALEEQLRLRVEEELLVADG